MWQSWYEKKEKARGRDLLRQHGAHLLAHLLLLTLLRRVLHHGPRLALLLRLAREARPAAPRPRLVPRFGREHLLQPRLLAHQLCAQA